MVLLHYKISDKNQFIVETKSNEQIQSVTEQLVEINNERIKLDKLMKSLSDLAEHGPLRPEALRGLTTPETYNPAVEMLKGDEKKYAFPKPTNQERENPDKTGFRTGMAPKKEIADKIFQTID